MRSFHDRDRRRPTAAASRANGLTSVGSCSTATLIANTTRYCSAESDQTVIMLRSLVAAARRSTGERGATSWTENRNRQGGAAATAIQIYLPGAAELSIITYSFALLCPVHPGPRHTAGLQDRRQHQLFILPPRRPSPVFRGRPCPPFSCPQWRLATDATRGISRKSGRHGCAGG